jgi:hypothetical protein
MIKLQFVYAFKDGELIKEISKKIGENAKDEKAKRTS